MEYIAVSQCLLGINSKYNGENNLNIKVLEMIKGKTVIPICPETFALLKYPRDPAEIINDKVIDKSGNDLTSAFTLGAYRTLAFLNDVGCKKVILKNGSPSCGKETYDGSFNHVKIDRMGITSKLLKENGFELIYID